MLMELLWLSQFTAQTPSAWPCAAQPEGPEKGCVHLKGTGLLCEAAH